MKAEMYILIVLTAFVSVSIALAVDYFLRRKVKKKKEKEKRIKEHHQRVIRELSAKAVFILKVFQKHFEEIEDYEQASIAKRMIDEIQNKNQ